MALFGMGKSELVTLSFETTDLRFLTAKGNQVMRWGSVPLPPGLISQGLISDVAEMGRIIGELFTVEDLDRKRVVTALTGLRAIPRLLALPKLQASLMEEAISREARKELPLSLENLYLSWQSMPGDGEQQRIYMLAVPRELLDAQAHALGAANIQPLAMDLKPLCLIRAVNQPEAIIANLEEGVLDVILVADLLPAIMRTFSLEEEALDEVGMLDRLYNELAQTVRFYNDSHSNAQIKPSTPVYIAGSALRDSGPVDYLRTVIERPIERPNPPLVLPEALPVMEYVANIGLAMKKV